MSSGGEEENWRRQRWMEGMDGAVDGVKKRAERCWGIEIKLLEGDVIRQSWGRCCESGIRKTGEVREKKTGGKRVIEGRMKERKTLLVGGLRKKEVNFCCFMLRWKICCGIKEHQNCKKYCYIKTFLILNWLAEDGKMWNKFGKFSEHQKLFSPPT